MANFSAATDAEGVVPDAILSLVDGGGVGCSEFCLFDPNPGCVASVLTGVTAVAAVLTAAAAVLNADVVAVLTAAAFSGGFGKTDDVIG